MPENETLDAHQKALALNLDGTIFGTFAEIGAGQEVARWFLRVGGASGTVAKTISAYDKEISDDLYGSGTRYVSKPRLQAMLESEWEQLLAQLKATRGDNTRFFTFVDTISARNFAGTNDCHGWMGLRFIRQPGEAPNDIILHINLMDPSNALQQEAVGILGVNLIDAAYHSLSSAKKFLASVFEGLGLDRVEIDCLEWSGAAFADWNRDEVHAFLVFGGYAEAVVFPEDHHLAPSNELLYKRALVLAPGKFDSATSLHANLIKDTLAELPEEVLDESKGGLGLFCLSVAGSSSAPYSEESVKESLEHVAMLQKLGYGVMLFRTQELYTMSAFANRYTKSRINFAIGLTVLLHILQDSYQELEGELLEGIARLFRQNVQLCVYPMPVEELRGRLSADRMAGWRWIETDGVVSADNLHPAGAMDLLYQYLIARKFIVSKKNAPAIKSLEPD